MGAIEQFLVFSIAPVGAIAIAFGLLYFLPGKPKHPHPGE